jgi:hypothetical protein
VRIGGDISQEEIDAILTGGLPESRTSKRRFFQGPMGWMERVYCANCGIDGGGVMAEYTPHVFFVCDACADKHAPPEPKVPADVEQIFRAARPGI